MYDYLVAVLDIFWLTDDLLFYLFAIIIVLSLQHVIFAFLRGSYR